MAEWIHNGYECSECGFKLPNSAEYYEWIERGDHGYLYKNYAVIPSECPKCHNGMTAVVNEGVSKPDFISDKLIY